MLITINDHCSQKLISDNNWSLKTNHWSLFFPTNKCWSLLVLGTITDNHCLKKPKLSFLKETEAHYLWDKFLFGLWSSPNLHTSYILKSPCLFFFSYKSCGLHILGDNQGEPTSRYMPFPQGQDGIFPTTSAQNTPLPQFYLKWWAVFILL